MPHELTARCVERSIRRTSALHAILLLAALAAIAFPAKWLSELLPPVAVGALCGFGLLLGWIGYFASRVDDASGSSRFRTLRHTASVFLLASVPMSCSTINYLSPDPRRDVLGFEKETPRGYVDSSPYRYRTRSQRRANMIQSLPGGIAGRIAFVASPHGATLLTAAALGALPFILLFRRECERLASGQWLNGTFWLWVTVATVFFLVVFSGS
jgi:hypothetical protein